MPDIYSDFPIKVPAADVFRVVSTPAGLDQWWTKRSAGTPKMGAEYLRILRRYLEHGETVPYEQRLDV